MGYPTLIRLGWPQLAAMVGMTAGVLCTVWIAFMPGWQDLYVRQVVVPHLEQRYGFQVGTVVFDRDGSRWESRGIIAVTAGGRLEPLGLRAGDVPFEHHGGGWSTLAAALAAHERNRPAGVEVVNVVDWNAGRGRLAFRTIEFSPR